jgi:hypothetical protein
VIDLADEIDPEPIEVEEADDEHCQEDEEEGAMQEAMQEAMQKTKSLH